ncbi:MAG: helix-turn-helix domain-containing protein [Gemmatimonadales bacterium]
MFIPVPGKVQYSEQDVSGFVFTEAGYPPNAKRPWHTHELAEFCFLFEGAITETCERRSLTCHRFDVSFKPAGASHEVRVGRAGVRYLTVEVPVGRGEEETLGRALAAPRLFSGGPISDVGFRIRRELVRRDEVTGLALEAAALELLALAWRLPERRPRSSRRMGWLEQARAFVHDRVTGRFTIREVAAAVGVHPAHLTASFRQEFGCAMGDYVRQLRVTLAREMLGGTDRPLAEVALAAGFSDQSHLTRVFRRYTGLTPMQYRREQDSR